MRPWLDLVGKLTLEAGEIVEGLRGAELLALEQHRRPGPEKEKGRDRPHPPGPGDLVHAQAAARVGELVVVLDEGDELLGLEAAGRAAAGLVLPAVALALVEEAALGQRDELLRAPR